MLGKPGKKFSCCHCHQRETFWSSLYWRRVLSGLYMHYFSSVLSTQITLSHPPTPIPRLGALAKIQHDVNTALIGSQLHMSSFTPELKKSKMPSQHPPKEQRQTLCQAVGYSLLTKAKNIRGMPFTQSEADSPWSMKKPWGNRAEMPSTGFNPATTIYGNISSFSPTTCVIFTLICPF